MEFGLAGTNSNHQNIQSESFVLSDTTNDLSIDDLRRKKIFPDTPPQLSKPVPSALET